MPDPRLQDAMRAIARVLRTYDVAAAITLVSRTRAQWHTHWPTWSVVQPEPGPQGQAGFRVRSFQAYYRNRGHQKDDFEASMHAVLQIRDIGGQYFLMMDKIRELVEAHGIAIEHHGGSGFEPIEDL